MLKLFLINLLLISTLFSQEYKGDVSPKEAYKMQQDGAILIDIRTKKEFDRFHPKGAIWIPYFMKSDSGEIKNPNFIESVSLAVDDDTDETILLICRSGKKSIFAAKELTEDGFWNSYNVLEGFMFGWKPDGLPFESAKWK